jgi:hypothetical protein
MESLKRQISLKSSSIKIGTDAAIKWNREFAMMEWPIFAASLPTIYAKSSFVHSNITKVAIESPPKECCISQQQTGAISPRSTSVLCA